MTSNLTEKLREAAKKGQDELTEQVMSVPPRELTEVLMELLRPARKKVDSVELVEVSWADGKDPDHELLKCTACDGEPVEGEQFCNHCGGTHTEYPFAPISRFSDVEPWVWHDFLISKGFKTKLEVERSSWSFTEKSYWVKDHGEIKLTDAFLLTHDSPRNHVEFFGAIGRTIRQLAFHLDRDAEDVANNLLEFWRSQ